MSEPTHTAPEFQVVVNDEEQYSLWPGTREIPSGWRATGMSGTRDACLEYVRTVWTDMRPKSVRERQASARASE